MSSELCNATITPFNARRKRKYFYPGEIALFEQTFKNIDDILHKDAGCSRDLDYVEQTSWILFLKYPDDFEKGKKTAAKLAGKSYEGIIDKHCKWEVWAVPKGKDGKIDHHKALTGNDLKDFVGHRLFPCLKKFKTSAESAEGKKMLSQ